MPRGMLRMSEEFLESFLHTGNCLDGVRVVSGLTQFRLIHAEVDAPPGGPVTLELLIESPDIPEVGEDEDLPEVDIKYEKTNRVWVRE